MSETAGVGAARPERYTTCQRTLNRQAVQKRDRPIAHFVFVPAFEDQHPMTTPLDPRRRRALYRAKHRGTKEMDWLLGRYAEARLGAMPETELGAFEPLLALPDPELQVWLMTGTGYAGSAFAPLIDQIRSFHGLESLDPQTGAQPA